MNNEKKVTIIALVALLIIVIGASYAFFTAGISSEDSTTIKADAGTMKINYNGGSNITLSGIYPRDEAWATKVITVTGNNTTDAKMYYKLTLVVDSNTFLASDPLQYELTSTNTSTNGETIPSITKTNIISATIELGNGYFNKANNARHTYQLKIYYPKTAEDQNANQGKTFSAHVEITSVKTPKTNGALAELIKYNSDIKSPLTTPGLEISAYKENDITEILPYDGVDSSLYITYGTGWEANGTGFNLTGTAVTTDTYANSYASLVGKYIPSALYNGIAGSYTAGEMAPTTDLISIWYIISATEEGFTYKRIGTNKNVNEALLASTEDDYGTSYYFRGAVTNNYVEFANKCWRIVRIGGDGTIKLILHNDNTSNASNPCSSANNSTTAAFARYNDDIYTSAFNTAYDDNAFVGFMYGDAGCVDASGIDNKKKSCTEAGYEWKNSTSYNSAHTNKNKSTILTNLEKWYSYYLKTYENLITDNVFCADKNNIADTTFNPFNWSNVTGLGYGTNKTYYGATQRLVSSSGTAGGTGPSLKCNGNLSKITSKIGLISADELAFAGYAGGVEASQSYLQENATEGGWWSLSPRNFGGDGAHVWDVYGGFGDLGGSYVDGVGGVRPYISLRSSTNVTGEGTSEKPYKIVS